MIDLHMHTNFSDGTDSLKELLFKTEKAKLDIISITDHNTCASYKKMEKLKINKLFKGNILVGCEFTTSYDNKLIEVLGYGFNYKNVDKYLKDYYTRIQRHKSFISLYKRLINKIDNLGLIYNIKNIKKSKDFDREIYNELKKYPKNKEILKEDVWESFSLFYRNGLTNPNSKLFLNYGELYLSLKEVIDLIHNNGGIAFLAHPYQYNINNIEDFLNKIYNENNLDGIECFYTKFSKEQTEYLLNFANKRNLLISGGSDYHGINKENHNLGIGYGNLNINKDIISNWNIKFYN